MRRDAQTTVDWFRLIWDMVQRGINVSAIAMRTGIPEGSIREYIAGSHPPHWRGELLIGEWVKATGKGRGEIGMETVVLTTRVTHKRSTCDGDKGAALAAVGRKFG